MRIFLSGSSMIWPISFLTQYTSIQLDLATRPMGLSENMHKRMNSPF